MNATTAAIMVAVISILGNIIQYLLNKKSSDMSNLNEQVKLLSRLQKEQSAAYERNKKTQQNEIERLKKQVEKQNKVLESNKKEINEPDKFLYQSWSLICSIIALTPSITSPVFLIASAP